MATQGSLSTRSKSALHPPLSYFQAFMELAPNLWTPDNPGGAIIVSVAENKIGTHLLHDFFEQRLPRSFPVSAFRYGVMRGTPQLRQGMAELMEEQLGLAVDPEHLCFAAGCGACLDMLFHCLADPGEGMLLPTPSYPAFDSDMEVRNQVVPVHVALDVEGDIPSQLTRAVQDAAAKPQAQGVRVRGLLFSHPSNPLGICYSPAQLEAMLRWCLEQGLHCISDEIYAFSVYGEGASFTSMGAVAARLLADGALPAAHATRCDELLHLVLGMSKDFCASGMRIGCTHTRNPSLLSALGMLTYFAAVSGHTQWMWEKLLEDKAFLRSYLAENKRLLRHSYSLLTDALKAAGISYVHADSGMFCWVDLRAWLLEPTWEAERALWHCLVYEHALLMTPGKDCHAPEPGYFRLCFAWMPAECLPIAVQRIVAAKTAPAGDTVKHVVPDEAGGVVAVE